MKHNIEHRSRLVLGTAQLGMQYGIANKSGRPNQKEACAIVKTAWETGIHEFDTAQAYGQSEEIVGHAIHEVGIGHLAKVTTKINPELNHLNPTLMRTALETSIRKLNIHKIHCLMLHREVMLDQWNEGLYDSLKSFVSEGMVDHIGVSVYSPERALQSIFTDGIDFVQLPTNLLDRRFAKKGVFEAADKASKTIYIRSVFLQGLLLMKPEELPVNLALARPYIEKIRVLSRENNITERQLALNYVTYFMPKCKIIVGVEKNAQLTEIIQDFNAECTMALLKIINFEFSDVEEKIIDPNLW